MYTPPYREDAREVPPGYRGETFREEPCAPEAPPAACEAVACRKNHCLRDLFGQWDWKEFLTGDLLLIALALLLFFSKDGDGCEKDEDLWLLILILFFLK